jgi:hypothetical protein
VLDIQVRLSYGTARSRKHPYMGTAVPVYGTVGIPSVLRASRSPARSPSRPYLFCLSEQAPCFLLACQSSPCLSFYLSDRAPPPLPPVIPFSLITHPTLHHLILSRSSPFISLSFLFAPVPPHVHTRLRLCTCDPFSFVPVSPFSFIFCLLLIVFHSDLTIPYQ